MRELRYRILPSCIIILFAACTLQEQPALQLINAGVDERTWKIELTTGRLLEIEIMAVCTGTVNQSRMIIARYEGKNIAQSMLTEDGCAYLKPANFSIFGQNPHVIGIATDGMEGDITFSVLARDPDTNEEIAGEPKILHRPSPLNEKIVK